MIRQIKGLLYFFLADAKHSLMIFWIILMSILVISLTTAYFLINVENGFMTFSLTIPIYIFCAIFGFLTVKESIPFSIKMGTTRKNLFVSLGIFFLGLSITKGIVASIIQVTVDYFGGKIGLDNTFSFLHLSYFTNDGFLSRVVIDVTIMFFSFSVMFVIGLLFYRYGLAGGGSVVGLLALLIMIGISKGWLIDFFIHIYKTLDMVLFYQLFGIGIVIYLMSFILLRKITILKVR